MLIPRFTVWMCLVSLMVAGAGEVSSQAYPIKPIRIVTSQPGGSSDFSARLVAQGISGPLGQSVIAENRGGPIISAQIVSNATPDGYTLMANGGSFWVGPLLQKMPYDPVRQFSPITSTTVYPNILVVHSSVLVTSIKELIAYAKAKPGGLSYAAAQVGSSTHLAGELFNVMAGVRIVGVPYKGAGLALTSLMAGEVQVMFASATAVAPHIKSGRLNALAVTSAEPSALFPGLPTVAAAGLPGFEAGSRQGIWAPAKTPEAIVKRLNQEIVRFLTMPAVKERLLSMGIEAAPSSPEQFAAIIKSEMVRMGKVIKDAGIRVE